jgi:hypothetical protein
MDVTLTEPVVTAPVVPPVAAFTEAMDCATERLVPQQSLRAVALTTLVLTAVLVAGWEVQMRSLGLIAQDSDDGVSHWAAERKALGRGPSDAIALIGDSRLLFDTDLDVWTEMTGRRPVQLSLPGTNAGPFLEDLANDERFAGLAVIGFTEFTFFEPRATLMTRALDYERTESPAQRFGHQVYLRLSPWFAFLDVEYRLTTLLRRLPATDRPRVAGPNFYPWKLSESTANRRTAMWPRIITDERLRERTRNVWLGLFRGEPMTDSRVAPMIETTRRHIERIRARGGEVLLVKPPADGKVLDAERQIMPRAVVWDRLVRETRAVGLHWEDYPDMRGLEVPEWSHLTRESATRFTRAYVREALAQLPWLQTRVPGWRATADSVVGAGGSDAGRR